MTRQTSAKSILGGLELTATKKTVVSDKATERRMNLLSSLEEQKASVAAMLEGKEYFGTRQVVKTNAEGQRVKETVRKRVKKWFYTNDGESWYLEVRYGNKPLQLAQGKTAIVVGAQNNLIKVIDMVISAVRAKELDDAIAATVKVRNTARKGRRAA